MNADAELLTLHEAAARLRQSTSTVRRKIRVGEIDAVRLGPHGPLRVDAASIDRHFVPAGAARSPQEATP